MKYAVILICLFCCSPLVTAEIPEETDARETKFSAQVDVNVVNVDVFVRDGKGNPVQGLKVDDFLLKMDGVKRDISNFSVITEDVISTWLEAERRHLKPQENCEGVEALPVLRPIWVVLYVDNENLHPIDRNRALRRIREFVTDSLHPPMKMMVVANEGRLKVVQDFTDDPTVINHALRGLTKYSGGWIERRNSRMEILQDMEEAKSRGYGRSQQESISGGIKEDAYHRILAVAREEANSLDFSLMALRQIVDILAGLEGRKSILYLSNGLPMTPGLGLMHEYATQFHDNSILSIRGRMNHQRQFNSLGSRAASQDINFYTIDAQGLEVGLSGGADSSYSTDPTASRIGQSNYQASMRYLAERTGGIAIVNTNDISEGLGKIRQDFFSYYSLGFEVRIDENDSVHRIEVELPGRKDVDLRFRRRFVARSLETRIQDQLTGALLLDIADNPMGLRLTASEPVPAVGERWTVPVELKIPLAEVALLPFENDRVGRVVIFVGSRDTEGGQSDLQKQHHEIRVPVSEDNIPEFWSYKANLLMAGGSHRVVVAVLDEMTRKVSYVALNLHVP